MSYYRRGYSWEVLEYIEPPTGGWNPDTPLPELPRNQAAVLDNFLIKPGKLVVRGGFDVYADFSAFTPLNLAGAVMGTPDWILVGRRALSDSQFVSPAAAHIVQDTTGASLAQGNTTLLWKKPGAAVSTLAVTRDAVPGPRWINFNSVLYGIAYDAVTNLNTMSGYPVRGTQLLYINGALTTATAPNIQVGDLAPRASVDLAAYYDRLFMLGGTDVQDASHLVYSTKLYFSNPIVSIGGASDWKDPVSGKTNFIALDFNTDNPGVALARTRAGLMIFRRWSTLVLRGTSPNNWQLQTISREIGCIDSRSVCECDHGAYFLSHKGLMLTDGITIRDMSGPVRTTLQRAINYYLNQIAHGFGGYATTRVTAEGHVLVSIGAYDPTTPGNTGKVKPIWCGMYDTLANSWVRITSSIWTTDGLQLGSNLYPGPLVGSLHSTDRLFALGDKYLTRMEDIGNNKSAFRVPGLFDAIPGGTFAAIPALWKSRIQHGSDPRKKMQTKRVFADYVFQGVNIPAAGFTITPTGPDGLVLSGASAFTTPPGGTGSASSVTDPVAGAVNLASPAVQHVNKDLAVEAVDASVEVKWTATTQGFDVTQVVPEIHGVGYEQQPTRDRR